MVVIANSRAFDVRKLATDLRHKIGKQSLGDVIEADVSTGHLTEIGGWVMPETLIAAMRAGGELGHGARGDQAAQRCFQPDVSRMLEVAQRQRRFFA